jgi:hypothetical protein
MLKRIEANGVRTIIVETASRFARDLMVPRCGIPSNRCMILDLRGEPMGRRESHFADV